MLADLETLGWRIRRALSVTSGILLGFATGALLLTGEPAVTPALKGALIAAPIVFVLQMTIFADYARRRTRHYYERKWEPQVTS